jgi:hypothetical protein
MRFLKHVSVQTFDDSLKFKGSVGFVFPLVFVKPGPKQNTKGV